MQAFGSCKLAIDHAALSTGLRIAPKERALGLPMLFKASHLHGLPQKASMRLLAGTVVQAQAARMARRLGGVVFGVDVLVHPLVLLR
eukprot:4164669-Ditylum_brightwellii.AAC.1